MAKIKMTLTGANAKETMDGSRKYLSVRFKGEYDGADLTASMNVDATNENVDLITKAVDRDFDIEFNENEIATGTYQGKSFRSAKVINKRDVKDALGFPKKTLNQALKEQIK